MRTLGKVPGVPDHPTTPTATAAAPGATLRGTALDRPVAEEPATTHRRAQQQVARRQKPKQFLAEPVLSERQLAGVLRRLPAHDRVGAEGHHRPPGPAPARHAP